MKRILALSMFMLVLLGAAPTAQALEVKASGQMLWQFGFRGNYSSQTANASKFQDTESDHFYALQRTRIMVDFIASENLRGAIQFQMGTWNWGAGGAALDTTSDTAKVRQAYIAWTWPDSEFKTKMGLQHIALPSAVANNPVFNSMVAGVSGSYSFTDEFTLSGFWTRPYRNADDPDLKDNDMDMFGLIGDWNAESFRLQPYALYSRIGADSGYWGREKNPADINPLATSDRYSNLYVGGLALKVKPTDKLTLGFDGIYGHMKNEADDTSGGIDKFSGYFLAVLADYRLDFGTLGTIVWYSSGDDADDVDDGDYGRMPTLGQGVFGFGPTSLGFAGAYTRGEERIISNSGVGTWGAGVHLKDVSFMENMTHVFRLYYFQGTNDKDTDLNKRYVPFNKDLYLTDKDKGYEVNFDTQWMLSNGLKLVMELGYVYMDWDNKYQKTDYEKNNVYNAQITFEFRF